MRTRIAVAVIEHQGQFLIGPRPEGVALAGYWEFPGGKMLDGESPDQAAIREAREETGLAVVAMGSYPTVLYEYDHGSLELHFIACRPVDVAIPALPFRWVPRGELAGYRFPPANEQLLSLLTRA
jgi:mutator protein MutT